MSFKTISIRKCLNCDKEFESLKKTSKFCNAVCAMRYRYHHKDYKPKPRTKTKYEVPNTCFICGGVIPDRGTKRDNYTCHKSCVEKSPFWNGHIDEKRMYDDKKDKYEL